MLNRYFKTNKGIYVESETALDGFIEISEEEYNSKIHPTQEQKLKAYLFSEDSSSNKKKYLFSMLKFQLTEDYLYDKEKPFFKDGMTVDEIQLDISRYEGDREDYVILLKSAKKEAKQYIRDLVNSITGGE